MSSQYRWWLLVGVLGVLLIGCTLLIGQPNVEESIAALETQVAQQEDWLSFQSTQIIAQEVQIRSQSTEVAQQEALLSYQSTQIGAHQGIIMYLATGAPAGEEGRYSVPQGGTLIPTSYQPVMGSVMIHAGGCCVGGEAGATLQVDVQFQAYSQRGEVVEMRVLAGPPLQSEAMMDDIPWEPFRSEKVYPVAVAINWTSFWVHVQYRDLTGWLSPVYFDEIGVEGH